MGQQAVHQRDIAAESASLEAEIEGRTLCRAFADTAANLGSREAVRWRAGGAWTGVSWRAYHEAVRFFALGVHALGFPKGGFAVLLTPNRVEHLIASHGVVHAGGTPVGLYDATASEQIAYVARHCQAALCVVEARLLPKLLAAVRRDLASVGRVIVVGSREPPAASEGWVTGWDEVLATGKAAAQDSTARQRLATGVQPADLAAVIYTSGTCGTPKGVMVTHRTALAIMASFQRLAQLSPEDRLVSYLPLAHVSEHMLSLWGHVLYGMTTHLCEERGELLPMLRDVRPTFFFAPPGIWDAFRTAVRPLASDGNTRPHHGMLSRIGLDECRRPSTAAAPIGPDLPPFCRGP